MLSGWKLLLCFSGVILMLVKSCSGCRMSYSEVANSKFHGPKFPRLFFSLLCILFESAYFLRFFSVEAQLGGNLSILACGKKAHQS